MKATATDKERRITGLPVSEGVVRARVCVLEALQRRAIPYYTIPERKIEPEQRRVDAAITHVAVHLEHLVGEVTQRIGPAQANIFVAQRMMIEDPVLRQQMFDLVAQQRLNAEAAVEKVLDSYEALLSEVDDIYLRERASDVGEIRRRLQDGLAAGRPVSTVAPERESIPADPHIIVAEELTASQTVTLDTARTLGFITERGGTGSHAAILARGLGIPAVTGIPDILRVFSHGDDVLLNGTTGEVVLWPSETTMRLFPAAQAVPLPPRQAVPPVEGLVVMANISLATEVDDVLSMLPEGIGLYRTEFELLAAGRMLTEDEQYQRYSYVLRAMNGRPVYFRLFDFGGDKTAAFLGLPLEANPCLGYRGARLLLGQPDVFIPQARALARASRHGSVRILYPMIADVDQFFKLREIFLQNTKGLAPGDIQHGAMLEVPSICLDAASLFAVADFGCIGSNDLIQYLFAVDRDNGQVAHDYHPDRPVFWSLLQHLANAARFAGRPLSLCGEMGGQPQYLPRLIEMGIRSVSVSPRLISLARMTAKRALRDSAPIPIPSG